MPCVTSAQDPAPLAGVPEYQEIVDRVSADSILATLQRLESLGEKASGTQALVETGNWLQARYRSFGYSDITTQDFAFRTHTLQNIIVTKPGTAVTDQVLIVGGHYDTVRGPGVNDNGSGVAVMLEAARVLADIEPEISVLFVNFAAEEAGLVGSRAYVREIVVPQEMDILLMLNIDEVGGIAGAVNNTVTCERDERSPADNNAASAAYTDTLAALTRAYTRLDTRIARAYGSDYLPFQSAGYAITGFYETNQSRYPHTPEDRLANMDPEYVTQIARATVAAILHFARADGAQPRS
jgi:Zn-dependent M28 family amino/carboxypeptidase